MTDAVLSGLRVLDLTEGLSGPFCTRLIAIYGAEVIKVEPPRLGDWVRRRGPFFDGKPGPNNSVPFSYLNTNKRSMTLNLDSEFGQQTVRDLASRVDVVVENYPPGYTEERGIGPEDLRKPNPSLVVTSIPMFDRENSRAGYRLTEINLYAMSGLMDLVGAEGKPPLRPGSYQAMFVSGLHSAALTLIAAFAGRAHGTGSWVETSSVEAAAKILSHIRDYTVDESQYDDIPPDVKRGLSSHVLPCKDGHVILTLYYRQGPDLAKLLDKPSFANDPRMVDYQTMRKNIESIKEEVKEWLVTRTADETEKEAQSHRILITRVRSTKDVAESEHLRARGFFQEVEYPDGRVVDHPGPPFRFSENGMPRLLAAPSLGEANEMVLCERLGIPRSDLPALQAQGVI